MSRSISLCNNNGPQLSERWAAGDLQETVFSASDELYTRHIYDVIVGTCLAELKLIT